MHKKCILKLWLYILKMDDNINQEKDRDGDGEVTYVDVDIIVRKIINKI